MLKKIGELIADLERAGFVNRGGRGKHRDFVHPPGLRVTLTGESLNQFVATALAEA